MILRLTPATAALVGESATEREPPEQLLRAGRWTTGPPTDEARLRALLPELGVAIKAEEVPSCPSRTQPPTGRQGAIAVSRHGSVLVRHPRVE